VAEYRLVVYSIEIVGFSTFSFAGTLQCLQFFCWYMFGLNAIQVDLFVDLQLAMGWRILLA
jgi:hypothetical protein